MPVNQDSDTQICSMMKLSDNEYELIRQLVYSNFGINLTEQKRSLIVGRLQKSLQELKLKTFEQYYKHLVNDRSKKSLNDLINKISTNYTYFFREKAHFELLLNTALPAIINRLRSQNNRDIRIWTAGCSTGEEPYTLAMLLMEYLGNEYHLWDGGILATDISDNVLGIARKGQYQSEKVNQLPPNLKHKYFSPSVNGIMTVKEKVKREVTFRRFNLMNPQFPFKKPFHIIFCRNVMIYFDQKTRENLIKKYYDNIEAGGYLFIGHSETIGRTQQYFKYLKPAAYMRN
jgi:chemotaxis protein methyltransferase CheR